MEDRVPAAASPVFTSSTSRSASTPWRQFAGLDEPNARTCSTPATCRLRLADHLIENFVGTMNIPVGIATNMKIDGRDRLIPMATEESSVVAAVCNAARQCYDNGGFITSMSGT
jgi:hydroxymethylglutaryl-CoA reductase